MERVISLYASLLITFLGVIVPLFGILLSLFKQGLIELTIQAEREITNSTNNLTELFKKQGESGQLNLDEIKKSIKELKRSKKSAEKKLSYLDPKRQLLRLFAFLFLSFFAALFSILHEQFAWAALSISVLLFSYALYVMWKLLQILVDVKNIVDSKRGELESKVVELLLESSKSTYLTDVQPVIQGNLINKDEITINLLINVINEIKIVIANNEKIMAKKVELGFVFPREFIIEKGSSYTIYNDDDGTQVVRYHANEIQGKTHLVLNKLDIKPIKIGNYRVRTFVKAENIKAKQYLVNFNVPEKN